MAKKLAFVEVPAQLAHVPPDHHVISLSPLVELGLERAALAYTRPEDYLDEVKLEEEGIANFAKVEALCTALDSIFADAVPEVAGEALRPARWHYFLLKIVYDAFFLRAYQLELALDAEAPQEVLYFCRGVPDLAREWLAQAESLYAILLDHVLPARGVASRRLEAVREPQADRPTAPRPDRRLSLLRVGRAVRWRAREVFTRALPRASRSRVLCLDYGYSIPYLVPELQQLGYDVWVWGEGLLPCRGGSYARHDGGAPMQLSEGRVAAIWRVVERDRIVRDFFCWGRYDYWPAVAPRLRRLVERGLPEVLGHHAAARQVLAEIRPDVVLMSMASFAREKAICHAARRLGIPTVVSRHGEMGTHHVPMVIYQDIDAVDWALCWGRWEAEWTRRRATRPVRVAITGAPMIEQASRGAPTRAALRDALHIGKHERVVLYAPTGLDFNWRYISYRIPSDSTYFRQQRAIVTFLSEVAHCRVVVKLHPGEPASPLATWIEDKLGGRVTCIMQPAFSELIHLPEAIVLDAPATALVQAVQSRARIYIYNAWFRWEPAVLEVLQRTCVVSDDFEAWRQRLRADLLSGRAFEPRPLDPELMRCLADPMEGQGGASRACARAVAEIAIQARATPRTRRLVRAAERGVGAR